MWRGAEHRNICQLSTTGYNYPAGVYHTSSFPSQPKHQPTFPPISHPENPKETQFESGKRSFQQVYKNILMTEISDLSLNLPQILPSAFSFIDMSRRRRSKTQFFHWI